MADKNNARQIGNMLKRRYVTALSIIALLVLFSQLMIQTTILSQEDDSRVVNIAGRQRMLSQRINKAAFGLYVSDTDEVKKRYRDELVASLELWEKSHQGLQFGDETIGLQGENSDKIRAMFDEIQPYYESILTAAYEIVDLSDTEKFNSDALLPALSVIQFNESDFLRGMDAIVFQYDSESKSKVDLIKYSELILLFFTILTLAMEALFIFRPAQHKIMEAIEAIETGQNNLEKIFDTAPAPMLLVNSEDFSVMKSNQSAQNIFKSVLHEDDHMDISDLLKLQQPEEEELIARIASGVPIENAELILNAAENLSLVVLLSTNQLKYNDKDAIIMGLADITRMKEAEAVLKKYATIDEMTGLLNKRSGLLVLSNAFEHMRSDRIDFSICFMDLDDLKSVNDLYGHEEGDVYINAVARTIRNSVDSRDTIFRYGGDEIVLILEACDRPVAEEVLERIQSNLDKVSREMNKPYKMKVSYGISSSLEDDYMTPEEYLSAADRRMYEQKRKSKEESDETYSIDR